MRFSLYNKVEKVCRYLQLQQNGFNLLTNRWLQRCRYLRQMVADTLYLPHCVNNKYWGQDIKFSPIYERMGSLRLNSRFQAGNSSSQGWKREFPLWETEISA